MRALTPFLAVALLACAADERKPATACRGSRCLEVPTGIVGLGFGMSPEEVGAILEQTSPASAPKVEPSVAKEAAELLGVAPGDRERAARGAVRPLPGVHYKGKASLAGQPASCQLSFSIGGGLSRIRCEAFIGDSELYDQLAPELHESLQARYGAPAWADGYRRPGSGLRGEYGWRGEASSLVLWFSGLYVVLENTSTAHDALLEEARFAANAALLAELVDVASGGERRRAVERAREAFERDMLGAPERAAPGGDGPQSRPEEPAAQAADRLEVDTYDFLFDGPEDAPVTAVFGIDPACPYCRRAQGTLDELVARFPGKIRVAYTFYLVLGERGRPAAEGLCAAAYQGELRLVLDALWPLQNDFRQGRAGAAEVAAAAAALGLDTERFAAERDGRCAEVVRAQTARWAEVSQVSGVPFFVIDGEVVRGAVPLERLVPMVERALERAPTSPE